MKVLFVTGFGPIVRQPAEDRRLFRDVLGIRFKEESNGYLHTEALDGVKTFALWPLSQAAQSCFGTDTWPVDIPAPQAWLEFDVDSVEQATAELERRATGCSSRTGKSPGARQSAAFSHRTGC